MQITQKQLDMAIGRAIEKHVNGKIKDLDKKLTDHINKTEPIIDALDASKVVGRGIKWVAGFIITIGSAILIVRDLLNHGNSYITWLGL